MSVRPFVCLSVRDCLSEAYLLSPWPNLASYFTQRVPLVKGCAVTLNNISKSKVNIMAELYIKSLSVTYVLSPWSNLAHTFLTECLWSMSLQ